MFQGAKPKLGGWLSLLGALALAAALGCTAAASNPQTDAETRVEPVVQAGGAVGGWAADFQGISNWINSEPLTLTGLQGKVVLVDFWTYTCVNCIRTLPYLKEWHAKYADKGLVIVGVHSPEFEFEKVTENVVQASNSFGLEYAIAQDNDFATWRAYSNNAWPAKYIIDKDGVVSYKHLGEGAYGATEKVIRKLLEKAGADLSSIPASDAAEPKFVSAARGMSGGVTRELYGGYRRNRSMVGLYVIQPEYYEGADRIVEYADPGDYVNQHMYLQGLWFNGQEELRHARATENYEDYIGLEFSGTSVNAVVNPERTESFEVQVTLDGRPLRSEEAGTDMVITGDRSYFRVDEGRLYEVVALPEYGVHELKLSSNSDDFSLFAFTFGAYPEGP